jgi:hypothetical protein
MGEQPSVAIRAEIFAEETARETIELQRDDCLLIAAELCAILLLVIVDIMMRDAKAALRLGVVAISIAVL